MFKVFDSAAALERCDDDKELLKELIDMFFEDYEKSLLGLSNMVTQKNFTGIERGAHAFKSALGNLGAMKAFEAARKLEFAGKTQAIDAIENLFSEFKNDVEEFRIQALK